MAAGDWKALFFAAQTGDIEAVKYYVDKGVNLNYQHPELLSTPLIESIASQEYDVVKFLLENGANPKLPAGFSSDHPLKVAKRTKNKKLIQLVQSFLPPRSLKQIVECLFHFKG